MRIRILGGGWYGCHLSRALLRAGHEVELHETADHLFAGASGANPARLHLGFHYPRSALTRRACREHQAGFLREYGHLTRAVPVNLYCVAAEDSLVDFDTYRKIFSDEAEFLQVAPADFDLCNVEGALLTTERHILIDDVRHEFEDELSAIVRYGMPPGLNVDTSFDWTIDCTFCANGAANVDRYEACVTALLEGPTDRAVTVMDGPFPSIYPWNERKGLSSLTSAKWTPLARCKSREEAQTVIDGASVAVVNAHVEAMQADMARFWPESRDAYRVIEQRLSIRAMPKSAADARLVDVTRVEDRILRVRAGKIDAVLHAEEMVMKHIAYACER